MKNCYDCGNKDATLVVLKVINENNTHSHEYVTLCNPCIKDAENANILLENESDIQEWLDYDEFDTILEDSDSYLIGC